MRRVLHIGKFYPPYKGGMETHLQQLCRATSKELEVEVIVSNTDRHAEIDYDGAVRIQRIGTLAQVASACLCPSMISAIRRTKADVVHLHSPNPTAVLSYLASGHHGRLVVTHHSDIIRQRLLKFGYEPFLRRLMARADGIICFSPNYLESSATLSQHRAKCRVIPHGIDIEPFEQRDKMRIAAIRQKFGDSLVVAVGRLVYYKGFDVLIRALRDTNATLLIIGTGPLLRTLQQLAQDTGVSERVHFLGELEEIASYYQAARVFAFPSTARSEAFGIVQLESMACGTPVINTQLDSGVPFVSQHDVSGLTVSPGDSVALTHALNLLFHDDALHQRLSTGAKERVRRHFTTERMANDTLTLYDEVLSTSCAQRKTAATFAAAAL